MRPAFIIYLIFKTKCGRLFSICCGNLHLFYLISFFIGLEKKTRGKIKKKKGKLRIFDQVPKHKKGRITAKRSGISYERICPPVPTAQEMFGKKVLLTGDGYEKAWTSPFNSEIEASLWKTCCHDVLKLRLAKEKRNHQPQNLKITTGMKNSKVINEMSNHTRDFFNKADIECFSNLFSYFPISGLPHLTW